MTIKEQARGEQTCSDTPPKVVNGQVGACPINARNGRPYHHPHKPADDD
jgi:hypothetical protein